MDCWLGEHHALASSAVSDVVSETVTLTLVCTEGTVECVNAAVPGSVSVV